MTTSAAPRRNWGLTLCQIAVPALAIPSAIGVAKFFSVADGAPGWTAQGVIAALGFELTNVGLSILDIRRPALHRTVQRVRFWSVTTAITMNVIAHYASAAAGADGFHLIASVLALVASVPLAVLYVQLAALLHAISAGDHAERDALADLAAELTTARAELAGAREAHASDLARAQGEAREARERSATLATELAGARGDLATARERHASELARVARGMDEAREVHAAELAGAREELARAREGVAAEVAEAREAARGAERERARLARELEQARAEIARQGDRSRAALARAAQELQASHGWGASQIGQHLGWPESTVRGWLTVGKTASAAD